MNDTIDGIPVTKRSVRFQGELNTGAILRAGQVVPMVVLVAVWDLEHTPGDEDDYHRVDVLYVKGLASPRSAAESEYLLGILRGEATNEAADVKRDAGNVELAVDGPPSRWVTRADGGLMPNDPPVPPVVPASEQPADDAVVDEEDDFVLPPPPPIPEGKETRRQIVTGDPQLRNFLGE